MLRANHILETAMQHWHFVAPAIMPPTNDEEVEQLRVRLDVLLDTISDNEDHALMGLVDILSQLIHQYEVEQKQALMGSGVDALKFLIEEHALQQSDLPEIGSQGVVSEILSRKRKLNLRQIQLLSKRFHVALETFID